MSNKTRDKMRRKTRSSSPFAAARVGLRAEVPTSLGTSALDGGSSTSGSHPQTETMSPSQ
ncbi:hypothetical protein F2Q70_00030593 [Brassica cretica]|uniref:Uncharacterized protein n=1 Tax=Brassica cretica TaxID=69181 RepID=A0A8S9FIP9_BRACR|nr:hypothetical protein F2Q70_00030593 [Brassica cretica]